MVRCLKTCHNDNNNITHLQNINEFCFVFHFVQLGGFSFIRFIKGEKYFLYIITKKTLHLLGTMKLTFWYLTIISNLDLSTTSMYI